MKNKIHTAKLELRKGKIANLTHEQMNNINGGSHHITLLSIAIITVMAGVHALGRATYLK